MFGWFKKKKESRFGPEQISDEDIEGLVAASIKYVVGIDGTVYVQFFWDSDTRDDASEAFSTLFSQINSGDLLESTIGFIEETLRDEGQEDEFARFFTSFLENQQARIAPLLSSLGMDQNSEDQVVVKPTDIVQGGFRGDQT